MTVVLVCGPPCAGKSRWVADRMSSHDQVIDRDAIAVELGSPRSHNHHAEFNTPAEFRVEFMLDQLGRRPDWHFDNTVYVIRSAPSAEQRAEIAGRIRADDVVVLVEPREVLVERAQSRPNPEATVRIIDWWLGKYAEDQTRESSVWVL